MDRHTKHNVHMLEQSEERMGNLRLREGSELSQVTEGLGGSPSALPLRLARPLPRH